MADPTIENLRFRSANTEERAAKEIVFMQHMVDKAQEFDLTQDELTRCIDWFCNRFNVPMERS